MYALPVSNWNPEALRVTARLAACCVLVLCAGTGCGRSDRTNDLHTVATAIEQLSPPTPGGDPAPMRVTDSCDSFDSSVQPGAVRIVKYEGSVEASIGGLVRQLETSGWKANERQWDRVELTKALTDSTGRISIAGNPLPSAIWIRGDLEERSCS